MRSYVQREGRITPAQRRALETLWPKFGIDSGTEPIDLDSVYARRAPRILEIGFGDGESLAELARAHPECDYLGIEVHGPGVGHLLLALEKEDLRNVRVLRQDAVEVLEDRIPDASLAGINIFFPDPWPKKRHHKRRLVQPSFVELMARKLEPGGRLHLATDWENYAEQMREAVGASPAFEAAEPVDRPATKFETRGLRLGHGVWDMMFTRV